MSVNIFIKKQSALFALVLIVVSPIAYAEIEECYSTEFGLNYASDMSQYVNVSDITPNMNQVLQAIKLEQNNAYYRVLDNSNKVLFDKLYDILVYSDGHILAKRGGKFGLIDNKGRLVHDFKYESIDLLNDGQAILTKYINGQLSDALVTEQGEWLYPKSKQFEPELRIIGVYYDTDSQKGYFQVSKKEHSGLIDETGKVIIPLIYDEMEHLNYCNSSEFVMKVRLGEQVGLIDHNNKFVVPLRAKQSISSFSTIGYEPFILSIESARQGIADALHWSPNKADVMSEQLINPKGEILITSDTPIKSLGGNLYKFSNNGKVGVINDWAEIVLDTYYDDITFEYDSPLITQRAGKFGILNTDQSGDTLKVRHATAVYSCTPPAPRLPSSSGPTTYSALIPPSPLPPSAAVPLPLLRTPPPCLPSSSFSCCYSRPRTPPCASMPGPSRWRRSRQTAGSRRRRCTRW